MIAPRIHPIHTHPGLPRTKGHPHMARGVHRKHLRGFDKFSRHHHNRFFGWLLATDETRTKHGLGLWRLYQSITFSSKAGS